MIEIRDLKKKYSTNVVLDIENLSIEEGKIYGLFGRNGVGKTTLLNILSHKIFSSSGEIVIDGQLLNDNLETNGLIYQVASDNYFDQNLKVDKLFKMISRINPYFDYDKAIFYAKEFDLKIDESLNSLSTGFQTIFKLCIGLAMNVKYILYDEPSLGLDPVARDTFYRLLIENYAEEEKTIIITTHVIEEISSFIEEVIFLYKGDVILNENLETLRQDPRYQGVSLERIFIDMTKGRVQDEKNNEFTEG